MAEKNDAPFVGGFEVLADTIGIGKAQSDTEGRTNVTDATTGGFDDPMGTGDSVKIGDDGDDPIVDKPGDDDSIDDDSTDGDDGDDSTTNDDSTTDDDSLNDDSVDDDGDDDGDDNNDDDSSKDDDVSTEDLTKFEEDITNVFKDKLSEILGWDFDKLDEPPKTVEDMVGFMNSVVQENSVPDYASDDIKQLDEYVKNGGDIRKFYEETYQKGVDSKSIDLEEETDQKRVVRQNLKNQGIKDSIIEKRIKRYEDAGVLAEEAEEAFELVKEHEEKTSKELLEEQQKQAQLMEEQQQKFVSDVEENIKELSDIKGITISEKEKKELRDYILEAGSDGMTKYQKDYLSDVNNLLESAYFTKNKDALLDRARKQGSSDSLKSLQKKLQNNKGPNKIKKSQGGNNTVDIKSLGKKIGVM